MTFIEELIEKLKSGPVMCWTRGGGLEQVDAYGEDETEPFHSSTRSWDKDGNYIHKNDPISCDLIAICRNPKLIQEEFKRDTQRQFAVGDRVVWLVDNGIILEKNEVVFIEHQYENGSYRLRGKKGTRKCDAGECFRFATPEEIAAAQEAIPAPPTQPSEQACTTLVIVCRGLETTKGTT